MIKTFIQGAVTGFGTIIPGVSGATMLMALGSYERLIASLSRTKKEKKETKHFLIPLLAGIVLSILVFSRLFEYLMIRWPIATNLGFCGLILGTLPIVSKPCLKAKPTKNMIACFVIFFALVISLGILARVHGMEVKLSINPESAVLMFLCGLAAASTLVIPGISGSTILLLFGCYQPVLNLINQTFDSLTALDFARLGSLLMLVIPLAAGALAGILVLAKLAEYIFKTWKMESRWALTGLILASPVAILLQTNWSHFSFWTLTRGLIALLLGVLIASRLYEKT